MFRGRCPADPGPDDEENSLVTRRRFLETAVLAGGIGLAGARLPAFARSAANDPLRGELTGTEFHLTIARSRQTIDGQGGRAVTVNGQLPAPLLRWREGNEVTIHVTNTLDEPTSIHWHGLLLPFQMDGVPGVSFPGIKPGETFTYRFPVKQAGTYWYHSHSGLQEQKGLYGPIVIEPAATDPVACDREHVVVLSDWTFEDPERLFARLKKNAESFNFQHNTLGDFVADARTEGFSDALARRAAWGGMRMSPADIADVTGATYTYLMNGHGPGDNWTALFEPGERVRLRIINASAMTLFNVRVPGLPMSVVNADGLNVKPVETDEFQIGVAETFDVVIEPRGGEAYTLFAEAMDRSGYARGTIAPRARMAAAVPALRERPTLTMKDMGMGDMAHGDMAHGGMEDMDAMGGQMEGQMGDMHHVAHDHPGGPGVANTAMMPVDRLSEPGIGLENVPHRVLVYTDLEALDPNPDTRRPTREIELHLTSNMERYMWSFDGVKFSEVDGPVLMNYGERLRMHMVNDTMMAHPIHLHGMFFDVVTRDGHDHLPRKHTIVVKPGEKLAVDITADALGDWAFHCHLLYHMHAGMMRVFSIRENLAMNELPRMAPMEAGHDMSGMNHDMDHGSMPHGGQHDMDAMTHETSGHQGMTHRKTGKESHGQGGMTKDGHEGMHH